MLDHDELVDVLAANTGTGHTLANSVEFEHQQAELLARLNTLIESLGRVDTCLGTTPYPDEIMQTLGKELKRLSLDSFIALLEPDAQSLTVRHLSIEARALTLIQEMVGIDVLGLRIPRERLIVCDPLATQQSVFVTN